MISFINNWTQGIVITIIISGIVEMILPKGNMKKYINVVIGIYVLFAIISPITDKVLKKDMNQIIDIEKYADQIKTSETKMSQIVEANNSKTIKDIYVSNLENDVKQNMKLKGYDVKRLYIKVKDDEKYTIEGIEITAEEVKDLEKKQQSKVQIDDIVISKENTKKENGELKSNNAIEIQNYLAEIYKLDKNIIKVY